MIGAVLLVASLLLYGLLLAGIDAAEDASKGASGTEAPRPRETGCYYVSAVGSIAVRGVP